MLLVVAACGDDTAVTTSPGVDTESTSSGTDTLPSTVTLVTTVDTTDSADATGTSTTTGEDTSSSSSRSTGESSTGETDTTTGGEVAPGQSNSQLVTAGTRSTSPSYTLVYTFGQPSTLQSTHESPSYRLQGGLVGANGSPP